MRYPILARGREGLAMRDFWPEAAMALIFLVMHPYFWIVVIIAAFVIIVARKI